LLHRFGGDLVVLLATTSGPMQGPIYFYHTKGDCSDARYFAIPGGSGFAYPAVFHRGSVFYTSTDPNTAPLLDFVAVESYGIDEDAAQQSNCVGVTPFSSAFGVVTQATDPGFMTITPPLRLK
jgi:hypothetical protein